MIKSSIEALKQHKPFAEGVKQRHEQLKQQNKIRQSQQTGSNPHLQTRSKQNQSVKSQSVIKIHPNEFELNKSKIIGGVFFVLIILALVYKFTQFR